MPDKRGAPQSVDAADASRPTTPGPTAGERQGHDTVLSAREQDLLLSMINSQLQPCAKMPGGGGGADTPIVNVRFRFNQDGTLDGEPVVVDRQNTPLYAIAADASMRAVKHARRSSCRPTNMRPGSTVTWASIGRSCLGLVQR